MLIAGKHTNFTGYICYVGCRIAIVLQLFHRDMLDELSFCVLIKKRIYHKRKIWAKFLQAHLNLYSFIVGGI